MKRGGVILIPTNIEMILLSYTEDKVVLNFNGIKFACLTQGIVRQATRPVTRQNNRRFNIFQCYL